MPPCMLMATACMEACHERRQGHSSHTRAHGRPTAAEEEDEPEVEEGVAPVSCRGPRSIQEADSVSRRQKGLRRWCAYRVNSPRRGFIQRSQLPRRARQKLRSVVAKVGQNLLELEDWPRGDMVLEQVRHGGHAGKCLQAIRRRRHAELAASSPPALAVVTF